MNRQEIPANVSLAELNEIESRLNGIERRVTMLEAAKFSEYLIIGKDEEGTFHLYRFKAKNDPVIEFVMEVERLGWEPFKKVHAVKWNDGRLGDSLQTLINL